jgi:hypothetical protein
MESPGDGPRGVRKESFVEDHLVMNCVFCKDGIGTIVCGADILVN